ncbi:MAG: hypothetical protein GAK45_00104 [Pseudomonas citronellolis]|nr:MAG: hypothetical protein GAK45_00104 [Pseudomonas citronellolis]
MQAHQPLGGDAKASTGLDEKVQAKVRKLQALAERGVGGEKVNAQRMLDKLLARHGLTLESLAEEHREVRWFKCANRLELRLAVQIAFKVIGGSYEGSYYRNKGRRSQIGVELTPSEAVEFDLHFDVLRKALAEHLDIAYSAFIQVNRVYAPDASDGDETPLTERDMAMLQMASGMKPTAVHQRLEHQQ